MEKDKQEKYEDLAVEEVAYSTQHALNVLLDILIEKGIINEAELRDKLDQVVDESPELDEVNIQGPKIEDPEE